MRKYILVVVSAFASASCLADVVCSGSYRVPQNIIRFTLPGALFATAQSQYPCRTDSTINSKALDGEIRVNVSRRDFENGDGTGMPGYVSYEDSAISLSCKNL